MVKEIYRTIGIYRITNLVTGKSYIGQTRMDFGDRRDSHFSLLNTGKHYNKNMQADWDIYGAENFEFAVIEFVDNPSLLTIWKFNTLISIPLRVYVTIRIQAGQGKENT